MEAVAKLATILAKAPALLVAISDDEAAKRQHWVNGRRDRNSDIS
jgi:hypothetical protein